ncbi:CrcB family protein [Nocardioides sp.]|uniref:fluoride efflux transporter FluC n=1 Tax=Nocardioides sp. TaxID=35761 RepID=UPI00351468F9
MTPSRRLLLVVAAGGALGALLRWGLGEWRPADGGLDVTTLGINVTGCFLLALLPAWERVRGSEPLRVFLGPGVLGGYTTFSAVSEQTRAHLDAGEPITALATLLGTLLACLGAAALGARLAAR